MANTLKSQLTYTLGPGASAALPHHIQLNGTPTQPDIISFENADFDYVSSTATTLTVINNGDGEQTGRVLCELWHTFERVFGDGEPNLPAKPFINRGVGGGGGGASTTQAFVYTCTGAEGSDFTIALPDARPDVNYIPQVTCGDVAEILDFACPRADRTTTEFRVIATAPVQAGDEFDIVVTQMTTIPS